jgi:hypothetical protein
LNLCILSSASVPFTLITVQVLNLALTLHGTDYSVKGVLGPGWVGGIFWCGALRRREGKAVFYAGNTIVRAAFPSFTPNSMCVFFFHD